MPLSFTANKHNRFNYKLVCSNLKFKLDVHVVFIEPTNGMKKQE